MDYYEALNTLSSPDFDKIISTISKGIPDYMLNYLPNIGSFLHEIVKKPLILEALYK